MRKVKYKQLSYESFKKYGDYTNILNPDTDKIGEAPVEFYRDVLTMGLGTNTSVSFSTSVISKRPKIIDKTEMHSYCGEAALNLDGDVLMHVGIATPNGEIPYDDIEVFLIPKGTLVVIKPGVWHHGPFPIDCDKVNFLIALPERTYANDCLVVDIPEEKQIEIIED